MHKDEAGSSMSPMRGRDPGVCAIPVVHWQGAGAEEDHDPVPMWDAGIAGSGLTDCITVPTPES